MPDLLEPRPAAVKAEAPPFVFERDTFAFPNELTWEYRLDPATSRMTTFWNEPPPAYAHRCFVLVRSVRQFLYHARFDPGQPAADAETYRRMIRAVVRRTPRRASADPERIVIPGYSGLRGFSQAHAPLLKTECGGAWESYALRSHWRMILPVWRGHQAKMARQLEVSFRDRPVLVVHLFRFPQLTINHGILLYDKVKSDFGLRFLAYDPNVPDRPSELNYHEQERTFHFPRNLYWAGGRLDVVETYRGWFY